MSLASQFYKQGDYYYLHISSDDPSNLNASTTKNSDFTNVFKSGGISFPQPMDIALESAVFNISSQPDVDAVSNIDIYCLCSLARPSVRVGGVLVNSLRRMVADQKNRREEFKFTAPLQFVPMNVQSFSSVNIRLVTDAFRKTGTNSHTLALIHEPKNQNPSSITLVFRPHQTIVSGDK